MFNWFISIFTIASLVILFATWMRAIRVKDSLDESLQKDWAFVRSLVFIAFVCELVLLIIALIGLRITFAYLSSIYLIYFSVVLYFLVNFFVKAQTEGMSPPVEEMSAPPEEEAPGTEANPD